MNRGKKAYNSGWKRNKEYLTGQTGFHYNSNVKGRSPISQCVTLFGNRAVADMTSEGEVVRVGPRAI